MRSPYIVASQSRFSLWPHPSWSALQEEEAGIGMQCGSQSTDSSLVSPPGISRACPLRSEPKPEAEVESRQHRPLLLPALPHPSPHGSWEPTRASY